MKAHIVKAHDALKVGDNIEVDAQEFAALSEAGLAISASEHASNERIRAQEARIKEDGVNRIKKAVVRAKERGAIAVKDELVEATQLGRFDKNEASADVLVESIDYMATKPGNGTVTATSRLTGTSDKVTAVGVSVHDACHEYVRAREPMNDLIRKGGVDNMKEAIRISTETACILRAHVVPYIKASGDDRLQDVIRAADTTGTGLGTIATGLLLPRNLGFLVNKLAFLKFISTDLSNEAALFNQPVFTRYLTPPPVLTYVNGVGYTNASNDTVQSKSNTGTNASQTLSTDVTVTIDQNKAVEIEFGENLLGSTVRNLFMETKGAQMYSLAEAVFKFFLAKVFAATWTGTIASYSKSLGAWDIKGLVGIKNAMSLSKIPDIGRFALLHSTYYDKLLEDSNLVLANTLLAAMSKDTSAFQTGQVPELFGITPLESQLAAADANGVLVDITDPNAVAEQAAMIGFAGNMSSMLFVSRIPNDYTKVLPNLPATAQIEIVTEPNSGLSMMGVRYVNHTTASASGRYALMYGAAQGDPRQGIIIKPA